MSKSSDRNKIEFLTKQVARLDQALSKACDVNTLLHKYVEARRLLLDKETMRWRACQKAARLLRKRWPVRPDDTIAEIIKPNGSRFRLL